jgi:hypothetical protein
MNKKTDVWQGTLAFMVLRTPETIEPHRDSRRPVWLSQAAVADSSCWR